MILLLPYAISTSIVKISINTKHYILWIFSAFMYIWIVDPLIMAMAIIEDIMNPFSFITLYSLYTWMYYAYTLYILHALHTRMEMNSILFCDSFHITYCSMIYIFIYAYRWTKCPINFAYTFSWNIFQCIRMNG